MVLFALNFHANDQKATNRLICKTVVAVEFVSHFSIVTLLSVPVLFVRTFQHHNHNSNIYLIHKISRRYLRNFYFQLFFKSGALDVELGTSQRNRQWVLNFDCSRKLLAGHGFPFDTNLDIWISDTKVVLSKVIELRIHDSSKARDVERSLK